MNGFIYSDVGIMKAINIRSRVGTGHAGLSEAPKRPFVGVALGLGRTVSAFVESNCPNSQACYSVN
jgi:hypothetical protein